MVVFMAKCLPRYLQIRIIETQIRMMNRDSSLYTLVFLSLLIIFLGLGFLFFGLNLHNPTIPLPTPKVESIQKEANQVGVLVTKVIDGDTIELETGEKVRYIGVDTPETVDPRRPVGCFGKEASNKNKELVEGKRVILEADKEDKDKYGRLLRYIFLPIENGQILFIDDYLIREGYGKLLIIPPDVKYQDQFTQAQMEARENRRGLWGNC